MAKNEGADAIMPVAEMKPLLLLAKRQPVGCALALTKDKQGVVLLDKKAQGRKLGALLKTAAAGAKVELDAASLRFGHASFSEDEGGIHFTINKEPPSALRPKLLEHLKKAGCSKCEISVDAALDAASDAAPDAGHAANAAAPAGTSTGAPGALPQGAAPGHVRAVPPNPARDPAHGPAQSSAAELTARLTGLAKRLASMPHAPGADAMATAARAAQVALRAGDLTAAVQSTDTLERLLGNAASLGTHPAASAFAKSAAIWTATGDRVKAEVARLQDAIARHYAGRAAASALPAAFTAKVGPALRRFDHTLSDKLEALAASTDAAAHPALVAEVEHTIRDYEAFLAADQVIRQLDANPFVPLSIKATAEKSLAALRKAVAGPGSPSRA